MFSYFDKLESTEISTPITTALHFHIHAWRYLHNRNSCFSPLHFLLLVGPELNQGPIDLCPSEAWIIQIQKEKIML
ncbi:hypothetical protein OIU85_002840 [Salix viminalis]|uniref:Uncharacterized protein n=1 Tax=Salix viminalis TaxID=40686 RepID=A0A9Q0ZZ98_SALVM|nr:hypothetical protein OIU85_002840 [Salix viminalis]